MKENLFVFTLKYSFPNLLLEGNLEYETNKTFPSIFKKNKT